MDNKLQDIARLAQTFRPFEHFPDDAIYRCKSTDGKRNVILTIDELRTPPDSLEAPKNGTTKQKDKWEPHIILWTCEWLDAVFEARLLHRQKFPLELDNDLLQTLAALHAKQRKLEVINRTAPKRRGKHIHPKKSEKTMAKWALNTVRDIWTFHLRKNRNAALRMEIVARWLQLVPDDKKNKRLKQNCWVKVPTVHDVDSLRKRSG